MFAAPESAGKDGGHVIKEPAAEDIDLPGLNLIWWHGCCKILGQAGKIARLRI